MHPTPTTGDAVREPTEAIRRTVDALRERGRDAERAPTRLGDQREDYSE